MTFHAMILLAQAREQGLTLHAVLSDIPHDATAFIVYLLMGISIWAVIHYGRKGSADSPEAPQGGGGREV